MIDRKWKAHAECPSCRAPQHEREDMAVLCRVIDECVKCGQHFYIDTKLFYRALKVEAVSETDEIDEEAAR